MLFTMIHGGDMNERIAELYKKGYVEIEYSSPDIGNPDVISTYVARYFDPEKFAELVIEECARIVEEAYGYRLPASQYADLVRKFEPLRESDYTVRIG